MQVYEESKGKNGRVKEDLPEEGYDIWFQKGLFDGLFLGLYSSRGMGSWKGSSDTVLWNPWMVSRDGNLAPARALYQHTGGIDMVYESIGPGVYVTDIKKRKNDGESRDG